MAADGLRPWKGRRSVQGEDADVAFQLRSLGVELFAGGGALLGRGGVVLNDGADLFQSAVDLLQGGGLFRQADRTRAVLAADSSATPAVSRRRPAASAASSRPGSTAFWVL